jgi:hypothetical protein
MARIWARSVRPSALAGLSARALITGAGQGLPGFQREFGIQPQRLGQMDQRIHPPPVGQRGLQAIGIGRQGIGQKGLQLHFAKSAARLLVGQDILQAEHIARQRFDLGLCGVDHLQPFAQRAHAGGRGLGIAGQRVAHIAAHIGQPGFDQPDDLRLAMGHLPQAPFQLLLGL